MNLEVFIPGLNVVVFLFADDEIATSPFGILENEDH